ncbi:MAG: hypothetical protein ACPGWR_03225 [Ardenticatenaceae bacterium]
MDGKNILDSSEQSKREQKSARKPKRKRAKPAARNRGQRREAQPSRKLIREAKIHRVYQKGMTKKELWKAVNQAKQEGRPRMSSPEQIELGDKFDTGGGVVVLGEWQTVAKRPIGQFAKS